ncbi:MAG: DUF2892 domain-containing protein [Zetaproteobacteria bacterium CG06_land_8_20_14_3_00_59_53]|nr:MAG: hypothetical protein AUK36_04230 [Zetaproteobacteria bacterium CG2_30_59_37]PIO89820.1 MAG: hypothetical protein COX56_05370 [Zetaproteobacteria bacterium CG23_combo_of_CG06-09_8_20_14_all_59_86]PIQ64183.1 MAG: hypothetical protein COV97_09620 [Zetaproteobacteria bacterium CG11_big_fil_rev_8_21_14_0_20_59_439]PIU69938.1 MAG: DUF2892 domain-containing protein [Zetaproteobacteria bacterium CG06_land_8_20_14_3_00_59_53]PIU95996.1 MAG: DUF2892 domain-containing protein [Zetaproteobacteria b
MNNLGRLDKSVRVWLGASMIVGSIRNVDLLPWSLLGMMMIATAWQGFCPLYAMAGYRTGIRLR